MGLLELRSLTKRFGRLVVLKGLSFDLEAGAIAGVIGPNGAGKSTLFNLVTGVYRPDGGEILFEGSRIDGTATYRIARCGVARTFQNLRLFGHLDAVDNVLIGQHARLRANLVDSLLHPPRERREEREARARAHDLLDFVGIADREQFACHLSYGAQRRLEIARALASEPRLLLLDEPAAGMNPTEKEQLAGLVRAVRDRGTTVLLIEHDMGLVMQLCERITVLDYGEKIAEGDAASVRADPRVIEAYLGLPDMGENGVSLLEIHDLDVRYGGVRALHEISLHVGEGEIVALLGANGAGKTSTLRAISGLVRPRSGWIRFAGNAIERRAPHDIVRLGIGHVPEGRRIFARMSIRENLELGAYGIASRATYRERLDEALTTFPRLGERIDQRAGTLSGGEQQMLAIARALMGSPRLLLLDEPSLGLSPLLVATIFSVIASIHARGATILLVEQNARQALRIAARGYVLENGRIAREAPAEQLLEDEAVVAAYLGGS